MDETGSNQPFEKYFSRQLLMNEQFRANVLLAAAAVLLAYVLFVFIFYAGFLQRLHGVRNLFVWLSLILLAVIGRTMNVRRVAKKWQLRDKPVKPAVQYANSILEVSIPTAAIIIIAQVYDGMLALLSPAVFLYFVFILLTVLELNIRLSVISGAVAAAEYLGVSFYYLSKATSVFYPEAFSFPFIYAAKALILLIAGVIAGLAARQIKKRIVEAHLAATERHRIEKLFGQQISPQIVEELVHSKQEVISRKRNVCVMFLDIRGFTQFCEGKSPEEIVQFQNDTLSFMIDSINRHHGIVNQILGDGFMATFGAPISSGLDCQSAIDSAMEVIGILEQKTLEQVLPPTRIGVGLHYGEAITGNVGSTYRKQYSITGNVVILASRIEELNKKFGSRLLVSREVLDQVHTEGLHTEPLGNVEVKGRSEPVQLFRLA